MKPYIVPANVRVEEDVASGMCKERSPLWIYEMQYLCIDFVEVSTARENTVELHLGKNSINEPVCPTSRFGDCRLS